MIKLEDLTEKNITVLGFGISNRPLIKFLLGLGCKITVRDKKTYDLLGVDADNFEKLGVKFICGENYLENIEADFIFRSPGIKYNIPQIASALEKGSILSSEIELFVDLAPCKIIGVTGSDGKTTTTTLISEILKKAGKRVYVGGNIGTPPIQFLGEMTGDDITVLELSSFQLQTMKKSPDISLVTNISPNHLDYHGNMEEYISAKENIFLHNGNKKLILNYKNEYTRKMAEKKRENSELLFFNDINGVCENDGFICLRGEKVLQISDIKIPGHHNVENYMAAIAVTEGLCSKEDIEFVAKNFGGVEHRIEFVRELDGVKYYNSSIDSSPTRSENTLNSFDGRLIVIMGGYDKKIPFDSLAPLAAKKAKAVILTGATADKIEEVIKNYDGEKPPVYKSSDFKAAVMTAAKIAKCGDTVILSPACASFDSFPNFEARGRKFKEIINSL